ncbi:hypothetical protein ACF0H5_009788 [Mactra antiquata]
MADYNTMLELECGLDRCRDMFWEFVYIVIIPCGVVFLVVFITSIILCCSGCKRKKKYSMNDETQILRYNSIRRASLNLRHLSHNRDTPLLSSRADRDMRTASLNLERDQRYRRGGHGTASAPGTLQRDRDRHNRHARNRNSEISPQYSTPPRYPSTDVGHIGSGVEYAELHHGITQAAVLRQERISTD